MLFCNPIKALPTGFLGDFLEDLRHAEFDIVSAMERISGRPPATAIKFTRHAVDDYGWPQLEKDPEFLFVTQEMIRQKKYRTCRDVLKYVQDRCPSMFDWEIESDRIAKDLSVFGLKPPLGKEFEVQYNIEGETQYSAKRFQGMHYRELLCLPRENYLSQVLHITIELKRIGRPTKPCQLM